ARRPTSTTSKIQRLDVLTERRLDQRPVENRALNVAELAAILPAKLILAQSAHLLLQKRSGKSRTFRRRHADLLPLRPTAFPGLPEKSLLRERRADHPQRTLADCKHRPHRLIHHVLHARRLVDHQHRHGGESPHRLLLSGQSHNSGPVPEGQRYVVV